MRNKIFKFLLRRILSSILILFLMISFLFILIRISPGSPVTKYYSAEFSPDLSKKVTDNFGLNRPVLEQYAVFLKNSIRGDYGISYIYRIPVIKVIFNYLPFTLIFATISFAVQLVFSFLISYLVFFKKNNILSKSADNISLILYSTPSFLTAIFLVYLFSEKTGILPSSGLYSTMSKEGTDKILDVISHMLLPLCAISIPGTAMLFRYLRSQMDTVEKSQFVLYLRSCGLKERTIIIKHVIPNSLSPLISISGIELGILFSGALITEVIFGLPGIGRMTLTAVLLRDYPLIIGSVFITSILVIFTNLFADIIRMKMDRRLIESMG